MSGYNPESGIFELNSSKALRYLRRDMPARFEDWRDFCAELFRDAGFEVLKKTPYGIDVVADDADVWEVLSGQPATFGRVNPSAKVVHMKWVSSREWMNVTDLGKLLKPAIGAVKVNKVLEALGLQTKIDGVWMPSEKASGLHKMRQGASAYGTQGKEIPVWHRSTADLIEEFVSRSTRA